jgi:branched-chain amino acid transport system substrate-binding protein
MSGLYADITGPGSETAAKMAAEDFGGEVLGRKIEILAADHLNKADLAANIARDMLDNQGVEMIYDVAASATALAAGEIAKARNKIIMFSGPDRSASPTRPAVPTPCITCSTPSRRPM